MSDKEDEIIEGLKVVCKCRAVKLRTIRDAIKGGADTLEKVRKKTRANTGCRNTCTPWILELIEKWKS